jgi:hypothetical protein
MGNSPGMRKLVMFIAAATIGYVVRRVRGAKPDPSSVSLDQPQRTVESMERATGEPVRP